MTLSVIKGHRKIRSFLAYDLEWVPGTLDVRCVGVFDGEDYKCYRTVEDFLSCELTSKNRGKWFYAHAGGLADYQFILYELHRQLREKGYSIKGHFSGSSLIIAKVTRGHNVWWFLDSYWLLKDKLSNIAKYIGEEKGGGGFNEDFLDPDEEGISDEEFEKRCLSRREWYATVPFDKLRSYNARDCEILWKAIRMFQDTLLEIGGQLQMTLASCSMQLFRRKYLKVDIETSKQINKITKEAYTASRVENLRRNMNDGYYFDINSSFPYAMTFPAPGRYLGAKSKMPDSGIFISKVKIEIPEMKIPPIPYRVKSRVFFPVGTWESWMTSVDIRAVEESGGRILKAGTTLCFEPFDDLKQFALNIFNMRRDSDDEWFKIVLKYLLNSLYGKFAESSVKDELLIDPDFIDREQMHMLMPGIWIMERIVDIPHAHFPISAHITAIARQVLGAFLDSSNEVYYCDTDGFATDTLFPTGKEIGQLKLEKIIDDESIFVAPKVYQIKGKVMDKDGEWRDKALYKAKGFSRMTASRFGRILEGEAIEYERMTRIRENIREGNLKPREHTVTKRLHSGNDFYSQGFNPKKHPIPKRFPYPDGTTRPWSIGEIHDLLDS